MVLDPLSRKLSEALVATSWRRRELPSYLCRNIAEPNRGKSFFIEEVVPLLIDEQALVRRWHCSLDGEGDKTLQIPATVEDLLMAQNCRLEEETATS